MISKEQLIKFFRKPLAKIITRIVGYGLAALFGALGLKANGMSEPAEQIGFGLAAVILLVVTGYIDKKHDKADKAEKPK